jgi:glycosyltransferase involved in cell wall biosynthesis
MRFYSLIIPIYNRPNEIDELLESLTHQTFKHFEVIVLEDGSSQTCKHIVNKYSDQLTITYIEKPNTGQGLTRNEGFKIAKGDFFIVFDSDCLIPSNYLHAVEQAINTYHYDAFGGPDAASNNFTKIQKAISYSMTSFFTTGGIRGGKKHVGTFHPRSFNMGISKEVWNKTKGYIITRMGEDIEFSIRIIQSGFKVGLIQDAFVYHKRRTSLGQFFKQLHFFGRARINIYRFYSSELKLVHCFPAAFLYAQFISLLVLFIFPIEWSQYLLYIWTFYFTLIFIDAYIKIKNLSIACLCIATSYIQLTAYGVGFTKELISEITNSQRSELQKKLQNHI